MSFSTSLAKDRRIKNKTPRQKYLSIRPQIEDVQGRWATLPANLRGVIFVSVGAILLTIMAVFVKILGETISAAQLMFCRALVGFLIFALVNRNRQSQISSHKEATNALQRGFWGACGNFCFFYAITHLLLADAMALQFSRPLS